MKLFDFQGGYRPDIDGLRALAILMVVLFHFFPEVFPGGFAGVDVFFVISGYLITGKIAEDLGKGRFSFIDFYVRRTRRIFPALVVVLSFSFVIAWFVLYAGEFLQFSKHVIGGASFISNFLLLREVGYFDATPDTKPLLNLWSLAVEEQFYLFWPLILIMAWRATGGFFLMVSISLVASFLLFVTHSGSGFGFYFPVTRFWEFGLGGLAWIFRRKKGCLRSASLSGLCIAVLLLSPFFLNERMAFHYCLIVLPVAATAYLMVDHRACGVVYGWLSPLGLISYPLYLWHWPFLCFFTILHGGTLPLGTKLFVIGLSLTMACLTFFLVEVPVRRRKASLSQAGVLLFLMLLVGLLGVYGYVNQGVPDRHVARLENSAHAGDYLGMVEDRCASLFGTADPGFRKCLVDKRDGVHFALIGDSKAESLFPGLVRTSNAGSRWMFIGGPADTGSPFPVVSDAPIYDKFRSQTKIAIDFVTSNKALTAVAVIPTIRSLFSLRGHSDIDDLPGSPNVDLALAGLTQFVDRLVGAGKLVYLVLDNPTLPDPKYCGVRSTGVSLVDDHFVNQNPRCIQKRADYVQLSESYRRILFQVEARYKGRVKVIDTLPVLCDESVCAYKKNEKLMYAYSDHISDYAADLVGGLVNSVMHADFLARPGK